MSARVGLLTFLIVAGLTTITVAQQPAATLSDYPNTDASIRSLVYRGDTAKRAARALANAPDAPETLELLITARRFDDALQVLGRIIDTRPDHLARALVLLPRLAMDVRMHDFRGRTDALRALIVRARSRLSALPREEAAMAARALVQTGDLRPRPTNDYPERLRAFIEEYAGTEAAMLAEVDAIVAGGGDMPARLRALDALARQHAGTVAGARALYQRGFDLAANSMSAGIEPRRGDPLKRFLMVHDIAAELRGGRYPKSEWTQKADDLIIYFSAYEPTYQPGSAAAMLQLYEQFVKTRFAPHNQTVSSSLGLLIAHRMADLYASTGEGDAGVERLLAEIGRTPEHAAPARYLLAEFHLRTRSGPRGEDDRPMRLAKARELLAAIAAEPADSVYHRKALARLAVLQFTEREYASAVDHLSAFLTRHPASEWAWVAALRLGQARQALGDWRAALAAYRTAASRYADVPPARVLGHAYAARALEAQGEFAGALREHEQALEHWDDDYGHTYSTYLPRPSKPDETFTAARDETEAVKSSLSARVAELKRSLSAPGSGLLERGRWLLAAGELDEAVRTLSRMVKEHPRSALAADARTLLHRARLTRAVHRTDASELESLAREPFDFWVGAAMISRAAMRWKEGAAGEARTLMRDALDAWHAHQQAAMPSAPLQDLEKDVIEIRNLVFRPKGDGLFAGTGWELRSLSPSPTPFFVARRSVSVKVADDPATSVRVDRPVPGIGNVLFWDADQLAFFDMLLAKIGGTERRQPQAVMEVPNQPVGGSMLLLELLKQFFPARPGHWGGWMIETFPMITHIEFVDAARTKAAVRVTVGYEGCTVVLEKANGAWTFKEMIDRWIT